MFSLWRKARRENSAASRLLGSTSLRFALHGWQRRNLLGEIVHTNLDDGQGVFHFMGDAGGEASDGLHLFRLHELCLGGIEFPRTGFDPAPEAPVPGDDAGEEQDDYAQYGEQPNQVCLRPRDRFWDIPVPKIDSAFDNLLVPQPSWSPSTTQQ
ncbi:hypothetical protein, partial [Thiolapillus sp.]